MKKITVLAFILALAGGVWVSAETATEAPAVPTPQQEQAEELELDFDELVIPELDEAGACCFAECFEIWEQCVFECGANTACRQGCGADRSACTSNC